MGKDYHEVLVLFYLTGEGNQLGVHSHIYFHSVGLHSTLGCKGQSYLLMFIVYNNPNTKRKEIMQFLG